MPPDMDSILEPLLALLAIFFPLGMTYIILLLQLNGPSSGRRKASAMAREATLEERTE
jgi:hypothetical protein